MKKPEKCLNPTCKREQRCRGLCKPCYVSALRLVAEGAVGWESLEKAGKAKPPGRDRVVGTTEWFLTS